jgi:hypothetical protein
MRYALLLGLCSALLFFAQEQDPGVYVLSNGQTCPMEGATSELPLKSLNRLKNRFTAPAAAAINTQATLAAMIEPPSGVEVSDEHRFDPEQAATITGYVIEVGPGGCSKPQPGHGKGGESCNCHATTSIDCDTHIQVGHTPDVPPNQRVIVEVTPRLRKQMRDQGKDWSTGALKNELQGHWITFTGWLLFDFEHSGQAENTSPGNPGNWRATCWEVHPVTSYTVLTGPPVEPALRTIGDLTSRQADRVRNVEKNKALKNRIAARNQALGLLYKDDGNEETEKE